MTCEGARLAELSVAVRRSTLERLRSVPRGRERWRPVDRALSFADLAHHLRAADDWLLQKVADPRVASMRARAGDAETSDWAGYLAALDELERSGQRRDEWLQTLDDEALAGTIRDDRFDHPATLWWVIVRGNLDHEAHHRGQIATYLRLLDRPSRSSSA